MPDVTWTNLRQWCVVWDKLDNASQFGQVRVSSPRNVRCRWVIGDQQSVGQDAVGEAYPRTINVGSQVALGSYVSGPHKLAELPDEPVYLEVVGSQKIPDLKGRHPAYILSLQKASKTLPTVVSS